MQTSRIIAIKNGTLLLPRPLRSRWKNSNVQVREIAGERIVLERVPSQKKEVDLAAWKRVAGMLKGRKIPDPVKWQRIIRKEWEREIF